MMATVLLQTTRIGSPLLGIFIPLVVFVISFLITWGLYRHFSRPR